MTKESEYIALRDEMMKRFDRIHDSMRHGLGVFIALIAYYHAYAPDKIDSGIAICLFQLIVFSIGIIILQNYQSIYLEGTHITVCLEKTNEHPWHRMSRHFGEYKNNKLPFLLGSRWGADSAVFAYILLLIGIIAWIEIITKPPITCADIKSQLMPYLFAVLITFVNIFVLYQLILGIKNYREDVEEKWVSYSSNKNGRNTYTAPYSDGDNSTTEK